MAYRMMRQNRIIPDHLSIRFDVMPCFDTIGDPDFEFDRDHLLHQRSMLEFVRDQLDEEQIKDLADIDAHWRANAEAFNADFATLHHQEDKKAALEGFIADENGETPAIPASHWWWAQIEEGS